MKKLIQKWLDINKLFHNSKTFVELYEELEKRVIELENTDFDNKMKKSLGITETKR